MKQMKKLTSLMAAILIVVNIIVINVSAVMAAPVVAAEGLSEILAALLSAAGHSQSEIDGMSITEMQSTVSNDLKNGKINLDTIIIDPVTGVGVEFLEFMNNPENKAARDILSTALKVWLSDLMSDYDILSSSVVKSSTTDLKGYGAKYVQYDINTGKVSWTTTCDYIVVYSDKFVHYGNGNMYNFNDQWYCRVSTGTVLLNQGIYYKFYGDVRYEDDTPYPTDDTYEYQLGETADGTKVTVDMLNPDGTVTIDGVTYYPADYIKPNNLTEEGKKQLVNNITNVINNTYVISDDKPIVDDKDINIEISSELEDFTVSPSIITVFPFCLPWDFVRGMRLFSAKPVTPHFEVTIDVPAILNVPAQKWTLEIDLGQFETLAKITRWLSLFSFSYLLISLSTKIVKGAGA